MTAEALGARLLGEVKEESLDEVFSFLIFGSRSLRHNQQLTDA